MAQFLINSKQIFENQVTLDEKESHHLIHVMRKKSGDNLQLSDGEGNTYSGKITQIEPAVVVSLNEVVKKDSASSILLCPALLKNPRMDWMIEKLTELGVHSILPFVSERSVVKIHDEKERLGKMNRWRKISQAALKQSGRSRLPELDLFLSWQKLLDHLSSVKGFKILWVAGSPDSASLQSFEKELYHKSPDTFCVGIIGPEGGFSPHELEGAQKSNLHFSSLGDFTLRAETAALAAATLLNYFTNRV